MVGDFSEIDDDDESNILSDMDDEYIQLVTLLVYD